MEQQDPTKERIAPKQLAKYLDWWIGTIDQTAAINGSAPAKRIVPILNGPSGGGKSALVFQAAERAGRRIVDLRGSQIDSVDVRGIPMPDAETRRMVYFTNGELPNAADDPDCTDLIFFDAECVKGFVSGNIRSPIRRSDNSAPVRVYLCRK